MNAQAELSRLSTTHKGKQRTRKKTDFEKYLSRSNPRIAGVDGWKHSELIQKLQNAFKAGKRAEKAKHKGDRA